MWRCDCRTARRVDRQNVFAAAEKILGFRSIYFCWMMQIERPCGKSVYSKDSDGGVWRISLADSHPRHHPPPHRSVLCFPVRPGLPDTTANRTKSPSTPQSLRDLTQAQRHPLVPSDDHTSFLTVCDSTTPQCAEHIYTSVAGDSNPLDHIRGFYGRILR